MDPIANAWEKNKNDIRQVVITIKLDGAMYTYQGVLNRKEIKGTLKFVSHDEKTNIDPLGS